MKFIQTGVTQGYKDALVVGDVSFKWEKIKHL